MRQWTHTFIADNQALQINNMALECLPLEDENWAQKSIYTCKALVRFESMI